MKKQEIKEKEKQHADGYARIPSQGREFEEWEPEQVWLEYEEGKPEDQPSNPQQLAKERRR